MKRYLRYSMLGLTAAWFLAVVVLTYLMWSTYNDAAIYTHYGPDTILEQGTTNFMTYEEWFSRAVTGSLGAGLCCPTVPYAVLMVLLGVAYFAANKEPGAVTGQAGGVGQGTTVRRRGCETV